MKRWIILLHRYLGIPMSVVFVIWFVSGIVMMYTGDMPVLGEDDRLRGLGAVELDAVAVSPAEAASLAGIDGDVAEAFMQMLFGRPVYRFARVFGPEVTVFADTGERFTRASLAQGRAEVARFVGVPVGDVSHVGTVTQPDQWTITLAGELPLERYDVGDGHATRAYFSRGSGEVELTTSRGTRALAWLGAIPHWFYFTPLRTNQPAWYWTVVWVSVAGCLLAALGLVLACTQFRRSKPFRLAASIRYRGWMRWHYYTGALFGLFALTWVFSGLLSMEPFAWTTATGMRLPPNDLQGGTLDLERYRPGEPGFARALGADSAFEIALMRIQGEPHYVVTTGPRNARRVLAAATHSERIEPFSAQSVLAELEATVTDAGIRRHEVLTDYDAYYYAQDGSAPLPVLRVEFDDPARTWYYFDLMTSGTLLANHRLSRLERWLFNGLHSLDFGFWYGRRPLWDIGMIFLSLGALATSGIGMYLGSKRLFGRASPADR